MPENNWREYPEVKYIEKKIDKEHYEVEGLVGSGGFGRVIKVKDKVLSKRFVYKVMRLDILNEITGNNQNTLKRFLREARITAAIKHRSIVNIINIENYKIEDIWKDRQINYPYLVMDFIEGENLATEIQRKAPFSLKRILNISNDILSALSYMHQKKHIHRDLKPSNIMLDTGENKAVIIDMGLALNLEEFTKLTKSRYILGSVPYMPPEQWLGGNTDQTSDIYSFGVMLYEMATSQLPFDGQADDQFKYHHLNTPVPTIEEKECRLSKKIITSLNQIIAKAMAKKQENRYSTADELNNDLAELTDSFIPRSIVRARVNKNITGVRLKIPRKALRLAATFAILLILIITGGMIFFLKHPATSTKISSHSPITLHAPEPNKSSSSHTYTPPESLRKEAVEVLLRQVYYNSRTGMLETRLFNNTAMIYIQPGAFYSKQKHFIHLDGYWISRDEVTFAQYDRFCEETGKRKPKDDSWGRQNRPVINVNWNDARQYCQWLMKKTGLPFDLPIEQEWEKAARAGRNTPFFWGKMPGKAWKFANTADKALKRIETRHNIINREDNYGYTAPIRSFTPNRYGLFDTIGNVWEWTSTPYSILRDQLLLGKNNNNNNESDKDEFFYVVKGGGWGTCLKNFSLGISDYFNTLHKNNNLGFRICLRSPTFNFLLYNVILPFR